MNTTSSYQDILVPWDSCDYSENNNIIYEVSTTQIDWEENEEDMKNKNNIPIISKKYLDMVAHASYLRKRKMENVSYPDPIEEEKIFYDCQYKSDEVTHATIVKLETLDSGTKKYINKGQVFKINNTTSGKEENINTIQEMIDKQLQQQKIHDLNPDNYEDNIKWYCTKKWFYLGSSN